MFNERYFSNLHNMIIPLYGFNHYHSASNCEENTEGFIGRDSIIDKLSAWLDAPKGKTAYSGAYLITGYRGMGKSSFVHKAVAKLSPKPHGFIEKIRRFGKPNLDNLSNSTDIEIILYKYYHICFLSRRESIIMDVLKHTLSARQLGCDKIISSLVQNIQNLRFKEEANEQTLFLLMPSYRKAFVKGERNLLDTLQIIDKYLHNFNSDIIISQIGLDIFKDNSTSNADKRFQFLIYLITDSLFCLNKVTDILSPLYSTTLYTNMYIGECYEREFVWNHILIVLREVLYYMQSKDKLAFINGFQQRYKYKFDESRISYLFSHIEKFVKDCGTYKELLAKQENTGKDPVESIYDKVCPSSHRYLTSSYLIGNAVDFYHNAVEMHTCGKAYKEMMSTLYFLEDDLFNNSCYFKFATELYCLNNGYIQGKINKLEKTYYCNKALFNIDNYLNDKNYE